MTSSAFRRRPSAPTPGPSSTLIRRSNSGNRPKKTQARQLLSCTNCRERKVKCDRTKPCSACCSQGKPKECEFIVTEGNDYSPIQQSYEIRKLRAENQKLREKLQQARLTGSGDDEGDDDESCRNGPRSASKTAASRQRRFKTGERSENLYFGAPCLANIISDFASLQVGSHSLTHSVPRGRDMYLTPDGPSAYPFPILDGSNRAGDLARALLVSRSHIFELLDVFQRRALSSYFPHYPDECTIKEVSHFLDDVVGNAEKFPDLLALIFAMLATGMQMGVYDKHGGWVPGMVEETRRTSDVYRKRKSRAHLTDFGEQHEMTRANRTVVAAAMQSLRLASFMNTPTLIGTQTLIMIGPYLVNSGRFLDAWTLFGTTIRVAHSIGLHRDPKFLDPAPSPRESRIRRTLWWWMLHMDQQYSVTLGRPLGISGFGDCPSPELLITNPTTLRLGEIVDHFTVLARQILSSDGMMNVGRIDEFTDKLVGLWDTMPEALQFSESWLQATTQLPEWPLEAMSAMLFCKVQSLLVLLNRQRVERTQTLAGENSPLGSIPSSSRRTTYTIEQHPTRTAPVRGRALVVNSSIHLLQVFKFFYHRNPAMLICWTMGQQAFNACMILILDAWETDNAQNVWLVEHAFCIFNELQKSGVHKLAELAVGKIGDGLARLENRRHQHEQLVAAATRRQQNFPALQVDTATLSDFSSDTVMGNTGMFLLENTDLQCYGAMPTFQPLGWPMASGEGAQASSLASQLAMPNTPSPMVPVSQVTAVPFPVLSSPPFPVPMVCTAPCKMLPLAPSSQQQQNQQHRCHETSLSPINLNTSACLVPVKQQPEQQQQSHHPVKDEGIPKLRRPC